MKTSIIIPCYNMGEFVGEALDSALATTGANIEVLVLDDGSTDSQTQTVLARLESEHADKPNVSFYRHDNMGLSATRNRGIELASGDIILPLDADNRIRPDYVSKALAVFENDPAVGVVYAWRHEFGVRTAVREFPEMDLKTILLGNMVDACSAFRKQVWLDVGGYDGENFKEGYEDWDLWLGALEHDWRFHLIPDVLFDYRVRPGSMVSACNEPAVRQKLVTNLIEKHKALYASCWPELLVKRELTTLAYEKAIAGYHQRYVEAQADFQHFATEWNERCERLESQVAAQHEQLHQLRHITGIMRQLGRIIARLRSVAAPHQGCREGK